MARLNQDELRERLRQQRPGYHEVVQTATKSARERDAVPDAVSPDLEDHRDTHDARLDDGGATGGAHRAGNPGGTGGRFADDAVEDDGSTSMLIAPDDEAGDDSGPGPKLVIMDADGKILSEQG
jgi:hypothetical protein